MQAEFSCKRWCKFLDPEGGSQKTTLVVVLLVGISFPGSLRLS